MFIGLLMCSCAHLFAYKVLCLDMLCLCIWMCKPRTTVYMIHLCKRKNGAINHRMNFVLNYEPRHCVNSHHTELNLQTLYVHHLQVRSVQCLLFFVKIVPLGVNKSLTKTFEKESKVEIIATRCWNIFITALQTINKTTFLSFPWKLFSRSIFTIEVTAQMSFWTLLTLKNSLQDLLIQWFVNVHVSNQ